jgi:3-oxoacyl-[acyl-carrier protein] reductase
MHSSQVAEEVLGKVAVALANEGVNVGITGRNEEHLKSTVAELEKLGVKAAYSVFDVEEMAQVEQG